MPENFILAGIAEEGFLFPERAPLPTGVKRQRDDYLRIRVSEPRDSLVLRFDTLEVWRVNDHTLKYAVSYWGSSCAVSWGWSLLTASRHVLIFLLCSARDWTHKVRPVFSNFLHFTDEPMSGESEKRERCPPRLIGKRLKEIASVFAVQ